MAPALELSSASRVCVMSAMSFVRACPCVGVEAVWTRGVVRRDDRAAAIVLGTF